MKFLKALGQVNNTSYYGFEFTNHNATDVCKGDFIWSDSYYVEVSDFINNEDLEDLINKVENRLAFRGALRRVGLL